MKAFFFLTEDLQHPPIEWYNYMFVSLWFPLTKIEPKPRGRRHISAAERCIHFPRRDAQAGGQGQAGARGGAAAVGGGAGAGDPGMLPHQIYARRMEEERAAREEQQAAAREATQVANNYLLVEPPVAAAMPDPSTLPDLQLLGTLNLPLKLAKGQTAAAVDAQLAPQRFGLRFRDTNSKTLHDENAIAGRNKPLCLFNLFAKEGGADSGSDAMFMKLTSVYRPEDAPSRKDVPFRVIVVDTSVGGTKHCPHTIRKCVGRCIPHRVIPLHRVHYHFSLTFLSLALTWSHLAAPALHRPALHATPRVCCPRLKSPSPWGATRR